MIVINIYDRSSRRSLRSRQQRCFCVLHHVSAPNAAVHLSLLPTLSPGPARQTKEPRSVRGKESRKTLGSAVEMHLIHKWIQFSNVTRAISWVASAFTIEHES